MRCFCLCVLFSGWCWGCYDCFGVVGSILLVLVLVWLGGIVYDDLCLLRVVGLY